jgi:hypothetical protein
MQAQAQAAPPPQEYYQGKYATVTFLPANETAIFRIHGAFIPMTDYQAALDKLSELVQQDKVQKLVVDAPKLVAYHQPSVEWSFVNWKKRMEPHGLRQYRYVLPDSGEYRRSLQDGLRKIGREHPDTGIDRLDLAYCRTLDEAVED